jgi:hypothetical protein
MLEKFGMTGDATYNAALEKIRAGLNAGVNFSAFMDSSYQRYTGGDSTTGLFCRFITTGTATP